MRGTVAKRLRRKAEQQTIGQPVSETKSVYKWLKRQHYKAKGLIFVN